MKKTIGAIFSEIKKSPKQMDDFKKIHSKIRPIAITGIEK